MCKVIGDLQVRCSNKEKGCMWTGDLRYHEVRPSLNLRNYICIYIYNIYIFPKKLDFCLDFLILY